MTNEPRVSGEDRAAAIRKLRDTRCVHYEDDDELGMLGSEEAGLIVDTLLSHGWGPRPTVSGATIEEWIYRASSTPSPAAKASICAYLRECGIEVTDD